MAEATRTTGESELIAGFDHGTDAALAADPFREWSRLRDEMGVFRSDIVEGADLWYVLRHDDVHTVMRDPATFSSCSADYRGGSHHRMIPVELDPPEHTAYRQLLAARFSPGSISALEPRIRQRCVDLIESFIGNGVCDFTNDFAFRFPTAIFLEMMGLDVARTDEFVASAKQLLDPTADEERRGTAAFEIVGHVVSGIEAHRAETRDDLLGVLVAATVDGEPLSDADLIGYAFVLYMAGLDTVANVLSYSFRHLASDESLRHELTEDPARWPTAVEEMLRYFAIVSVARTVTTDTTFRGCPMRAGDRVVVSTAAAGRDSDAFVDADRFDPNREANRHLTFGAGPHRCLGSHLARLELRVAMEEWHRRIPDYTIVPGSTIVEHVGPVAGLDRLPLVWSA